ncbi:phosphoserine phosphatase SerB [Kocuria polaris]|nr:phosphoserine phosphatase SerB [Kocuria polaris]
MQITAYVVHIHRADAAPALTAEALTAAVSHLGTVVGSQPLTGPQVHDDATHAPGIGYAGVRLAVEDADVVALRAAVDAALLRAGVPAPEACGESARTGESVAVVPASLMQAPTKLLVMDVDSTLIQQEVIEMLAAHAGREAEVAAVTEAAMRGELDFAQSLHARVETLAGLDASVIDAVRERIALSPGARDLVRTLRAGGHRIGVVSGGFIQILRPLADELGLDFAVANDLEIADGRLTGRVTGEVVDRAAKERYLRQWAQQLDLPLEATIAAGDGANDLDMVRASGLGVAYCAKQALASEADARIDLPRLDVLGVYAGL